MSAAYERFARAAQREAFRARILQRTPTPRPEAQLEAVYRMASVTYGWRTPYSKLSEIYAWQRRMAVTRAWACVRLARMTGLDAWRREAREALANARLLHRAIERARREGR